MSDMENIWGYDSTTSLAVVVVMLLCLFCLRNWLRLLPSLTECVFRAKGNSNLEVSIPLSRDRNTVALVSILPFCLLSSRLRLWEPDFVEGMSDFKYFAVTLGAFMCYVLLRSFIHWRIMPHRRDRDRNGVIKKCGWNYFIILVSVLLACVGIMNIFDASILTIKKFSLGVLCLFFLLFIIRKSEILGSFCNPFRCFLYLCVLEFMPLGALVASALFL